MSTLQNYKDTFLKATSHIKRDNLDALLNWLENETDFFTSPASTNFHGNYPGGLVQHSLNVLEFALNTFNYMIKKKPELLYLKESVILSALFHDVCKVNCYIEEEKFTKDSNNKWVKYKGYTYKDDFPYGHGEKSVYMINQFIKLKNEEALAIRYHMSSYEISPTLGNISKMAYDAANAHPLVKIIYTADSLATAIEETIDHKQNILQ